ncbi:YbaY family lipoprotein [Dyella tabacisoli]|uniref:DUF1481 domain-containing protein n=1 Tax=Dyella tabacisoli TaxID=2282381 RepID=A0A369UJV3_9GAMM|nr:DUF1481 domain-containing protein [Dyella tabacisoli]RDD80796.1 DUF1481 domain-containing protein [Dyella tabacisoli]
MRRLVWSLMSVAVLAAAGCNSSDTSQQATDKNAGATTPAAKANVVSGTVALREAAQLSPAAKLEINLVDVSASNAKPLASKTISPVASLPQSFELEYNSADVAPSDLYVLQAVLTDGDRRYVMPIQAPIQAAALTQGSPGPVSTQLVAEQTPGEKELIAFKDVQAHIGGMKITPGTKLDKDVSRSWQVFREGGTVKFIREQVDYGDKGFTSTDYAYKDGKPWVVVQQKKSGKDAKPSLTERASWNADGALVLKQNEAGGKTQPLNEDDAASLQKQSQSILNLATGGKGK